MQTSASAVDFIGRDRVCDEIHARMSAGRIVTLVGPGGVGKTRIARALIDREGGVFVDLAALRDPELVLALIAECVGNLETNAGLLESLSRHLTRDSRIIVLDNCEHLREAVARIVQQLIDAAPGARLIATSRIALATRSECVFPVGPLAPENARALFRARAREADPRYVDQPDAVERICRRVDYLPLAIELAAARIKFLPVAALATRLDGRMQLLGDASARERQDTIRTLVGWSDELLDADLRAWFYRFGIFVGAWSDEAAAAIADRPIEEAASAARALVERSLALAVGDGRTRLFEPMRDYAAERLSEDPERAAIAERHAIYYGALAVRLGAAQADPAAFRALENDMGNLRSALTWALLRGEPTFALRFATALSSYWNNHGHLSEGTRWLSRALERVSTVDAASRARALLELRRMNSGRSRYDVAEDYGQRALADARESGDPALVAEALFGLAINAFDRGAYVSSAERLSDLEALGTLEVPGITVAHSLNLAGLLHLMRGNHGAAASAYTAALERSRSIDDHMGAARALSNLGNLDMYAGRHDAATLYYEESLVMAKAFNNMRLMCVLHANLGELGIRRGDPASARKHAGAEYALAQSAGRAIHVPSALDVLAAAEFLDSRFDSAAALFSHAKRLRSEIGTQIDPANVELVDSFVARTRAALGNEAFSEAWRRGFELETHELGLDELFAS